MKNISTGFGLALLAGAILAYPFVSSLAPNANASAVTAAASAVGTAANGQTEPTIVWYGVGGDGVTCFARAWSNGRLEAKWAGWSKGSDGCQLVDYSCDGWLVVSDPAQGLTFRSDINFDAKVDGADLGQLLADWGDAPRNDIPPSDCPLALIKP